MKTSRKTFLGLLAALIAVALIAGMCYRSRTVTSAILSDFEWFQGLGFRDVKSLPYVRVATGHWNQRGDDDSRSNQYVYAFLLATNANTFTVQTVGLAIETYTNTPSSTPEYERVGFEILDLRKIARAEVKILQHPVTEDSFIYHSDGQASGQTETFVLAWACWRNGLSVEARALYDEAKRMPRQFVRKRRRTTRKILLDAWDTLKARWQELSVGSESGEPRPTLRQSVEKNLAEVVMWRAVEAFGDKTLTRPQLLAQMNAILAHYPHCENEQQIGHTMKVLQRMIAEDQAHVPVDSNALARLPVEARVRELIFELRDQTGQQYMDGGASDIFADADGVTNTPAHQLLGIGNDAVPQLIEALDSDAWTRVVGFRYRFGFSCQAYTVGDCARIILEKVGCKAFVAQPGITNESGQPTSAAYRKSAEEWWADWQTKGEKRMLIEAVMGANYEAVNAANRLCERYPDVAVQTLTNAIRAAASESWVRNQLLGKVASLKADGVIEMLQREMADGPQLSSRVRAAYGLMEQGKTEAIAAMIQEWQAFVADSRKEQDGAESLVRFLASCNSVEAVSALKDGLVRCPVELRLQVIINVGDTNEMWAFGHKIERPPVSTVEADENLLVSALSDVEEVDGTGGSRYGVSYSNPRICDMAAWHLSERWPDRYKFDMSKPLKSRDAQRIACLNVWRQAHHLPLEIPPPEPQRAKVSRKEANKITSIEFAPNGVKLQPKFQADITRLKNKPLRADDFVNLLANFIKSPARGTAGLQITASRDEDLTGVQMTVRLIPISASTGAQNWDFNESVEAGKESILGSSGGGSFDGTDEWDDLADAIEQATSSPPETPFRIHVRLKRQ